MSKAREALAVPCGECGMIVSPAEYHPFAACLMFKGCPDGAVVRANLATPEPEAAPAAQAGPVQGEGLS